MNSPARNARLRTGMSIEEAAKKIGIQGGYLSEIERGKRKVGSERARQIADLYGVPQDSIFKPSRYAVREEGISTA